MPAFNPAAHGVALDWNEKIVFRHGGKNYKRRYSTKVWMLTVDQTLPPSLDFFKRGKTSMVNRLILYWGRLSLNRMGGTEWNI